MLPWDLEDWLTETGDVVVHRIADHGASVLTAREQLIHDVWLLDTEIRNGGIEQYFGNHGTAEWQQLKVSADPASLPALSKFIAAVDAALAHEPGIGDGSVDSPKLNETYYEFQVPLVRELRAWCEESGT